jgi:hypothetical protein
MFPMTDVGMIWGGDHLDPDLHELKELLMRFIPSILDDQGQLFSGGGPYYARLTDHVVANDPGTTDLVKEFVERVRTKYKPWCEHMAEMEQIPLERAPIHASSEDICCICHDPLKTWRKVVRLKPESGDPGECGHVIHHKCMLRLKPGEDGTFTCPLCRASLGYNIVSWVDMEPGDPRF